MSSEFSQKLGRAEWARQGGKGGGKLMGEAQLMLMPPQTFNAWPVTMRASSLAR